MSLIKESQLQKLPFENGSAYLPGEGGSVHHLFKIRQKYFNLMTEC